ncbi:MAG: hypothetical protein IKR73_05940, partial [Oscillospiraceae bacterium]|nr:hypothetical protein [Oscillospiraceae bacterium]
FYKITGVRDKSSYCEELFRMYYDLKKSGRELLVLNAPIPLPKYDELSKLRHGNYKDIEQAITDLSVNLCSITDSDLQKTARKAFMDVMLEYDSVYKDVKKAAGVGAYILCWFERYRYVLLKNIKMPNVACLLLMGGCGTVQEAYFIKFMARLPIDVAVFVPDLSKQCLLDDKLLFDRKYDNSLDNVRDYPTEQRDRKYGTAAYHAERELDTIMYEDSGLYREHQFSKQNTVVLRTMYEEIAGLWNEELKYRPGFSTEGDAVNIPVIFSKVSGVNVQGSDVTDYWLDVKKYLTPETRLIPQIPFSRPERIDMFMSYATSFVDRSGMLQRDRIMSHRDYPFGFLRKEVQDLILDKAQLMIDKKYIKGTLVNGMEYRIISVVLSLDMDTVRTIQQFDFTRKNPKIVCIAVNERTFSADDVIYLTFMSLVGYDVMVFVPTGYECFGNFLTEELYEEHKIGGYRFDLYVPNFNTVRESIFKRVLGNKRK